MRDAQTVIGAARHLSGSFPEMIHLFTGRADRWCEVCNKPDRAIGHRLYAALARFDANHKEQT
jgi:hypothetical protein